LSATLALSTVRSLSVKTRTCFGGLVITCSLLDPRFMTKINGSLSTMKIHSTTSFGWEVKPGVSRVIHVKELFTHDKRWRKIKLGAIFGCLQSTLLCSWMSLQSHSCTDIWHTEVGTTANYPTKLKQYYISASCCIEVSFLCFKYTINNATMIFNKRHLKYVFH
jgi:hypothetical protein